MNDEQTPDDRLRAVLEAITRRGHEGLAALLVRILEGRAPVADGHSSGTSGGPALDHGPGLGAPADEWGRHLGLTADDTAGGHPFDQEHS